jgi:hypothetical protein
VDRAGSTHGIRIQMLVGKPRGKGLLRRADIIKLDIREVGCETVKRIQLSHYRVQWWNSIGIFNFGIKVYEKARPCNTRQT